MLAQFLKKLKEIAWLIPGFLLWAAFPPMSERTDVIFAIAPLLWLSRRGEIRQSFKRWFFNGILFWVATLSWMPAIVKNGGPWPLVALGWFALSAYCALYFAAFGATTAIYWRWAAPRAYWLRILGLIIVEPFLWAGFELLRSELFGGFSWNHLGVPLVNAGFGAPARLGGIYLCSAIVVLLNGTWASIFERMFKRFAVSDKAQTLPSYLRAVETFLPFALVYLIFHFSSIHDVQNKFPEKPNNAISVALVQRNFPCVFSRDQNEENPYEAYTKLLSNVSLLRPSLVVLPESAFCEIGRLDKRAAKEFAGFIAEKTGAKAVLAGGSRNEHAREYNSSALYLFEGKSLQSIQTYDKVHLVPFGEYIPGDKLIPYLQKFAPVGSCTPGELKTLYFNDVKIGVAICFEDTDSAQIRRLAAMGAEMLVFITNDSWFSDSIEPLQHYWQAQSRAIETGLSVVRVGNSGVTAVIRPDGKSSILSDSTGKPLIDERGAMYEWVLPSSSKTIYVRCGDLPLIILFSLLILMVILIQYGEYYEKRRTMSM